MRNVFNHLLATLCIADMLLIMTNMMFTVNTLHPNHPNISLLVPWSDGLGHIAVTMSVFLTIALTAERYYAVCSPYSYQTRVAERGHWWILSSYTIPVGLAATILNIPKLLHLIKANFVKKLFRHHIEAYIKFGIIYQVFHPLSTTCLIPIFVLCILNYRIFIGSKRTISHSSNTDTSLAKIMMTVVAVFILLSIPKVFLALYEVSTIPTILDCHQRKCRYHISPGRWVADSIIRYLVMLNSSINFIIYCFVGSNFRQTLLRSLQAWLCKSKCADQQVQVQLVQVRNKNNLQCEGTQRERHENEVRMVVKTHSEDDCAPALLVSGC